MTNNKNAKGIFHLRIFLRDVFGFAEHQEKATYGLGYKLTLTRNKEDDIIDKANGIVNARIKIVQIFGMWLIIHLLFNIKVFCQIKH